MPPQEGTKVTRGSLCLLCFFVAALLFPIHSAACSLVACLDHGIEMRSSFEIEVRHAGKPLLGVAIQITVNGNPNTEVFSGRTSTNGTLEVPQLPPGDYWLSAEMLGITAAYHCFHVASRPTRKARSKADYKWGEFATPIQQVTGTVNDFQPGEGGTPLWNLTHPVDRPI